MYVLIQEIKDILFNALQNNVTVMSPLFNYSTLGIKRLLIVFVSITKILLYAGIF